MESNEFSSHDTKYITAMGSVAHTYGNLLATAQRWLLDVFPDNLFKTIHVSSRIAHMQMVNTPHQFLKKSKPMLVVSPRISYNEDTFLKGTLMTERMGGPRTSSTPGTIDLNPFFFDDERKIDGEFTQVRRVMFMDVILTFNTLIQQMNYMDYLLQELPQDRPFDIDTYLEAYLPREIMEMIGTLGGVPIHDETGSVHDFLDYVNTHSYYPITYKLAGSTGKEEFYRHYKTKIIATIQDMDRDTGENQGQIMTNFKITFTMKLEFWTPGTNYIFSDHIHEIPKPSIPMDSTLIPIFADIFMYEDLNLAPGWKVHGHSSFILDKPNDEMNYSSLLNQSIKEVLAYHIKNGIPIINFMDVKVRKQGNLLSLGKDYDVDIENSTVLFKNKDYGFFTYTIIVSIDTLYVNNLIKELNNFK